MPKSVARELSAIAVRNLSVDGRYMVGGAMGLHLRIAGKSKSWIVRVTVNGKRCDVGLGSFDKVTLSQARDLAKKVHAKIADDIDPLAERRAKREAIRATKPISASKTKADAMTFERCVELFFDDPKMKIKLASANKKHADQWRSTLKEYAFKVIGSMPVHTIETPHILDVLKQPKPMKDGQTLTLWEANPETASRLRGRIEKVLGWATFHGHRTGDNPARWKDHLDNALPARNEVRKVKHHASLPYADLGAFMAELQKRDGISARALEFAILCASRSGEVRGATWGEFDLSARKWTIPADRMKAGIEHVVPLSDAAMAVLGAMRALPKIERDADAPDYVFPAPMGGALSDMALTAVLKRMDRAGLTQHGFRSTFREWAGETTAHPREVIEHALAHQLADRVEAAYQRGALYPKRVPLMADWANFCGKVPTGGNVVPIGVAA